MGCEVARKRCLRTCHLAGVGVATMESRAPCLPSFCLTLGLTMPTSASDVSSALMVAMDHCSAFVSRSLMSNQSARCAPCLVRAGSPSSPIS
eukprot:5776918-Pleurochrysis_carterae.AAC.1